MTDVMDAVVSDVPAMVAEYMLPQWKLKADEIASIDEQLNTDGGRSALVKEAIASLGEERADHVTTTVDRLLSGLTDTELFAVDALIQKVRRSVASQVAKYAEDNKREAVEVPEEEQKRLRELRKEAVNGANMLRQAVIVTTPQWAGTMAAPSDAVNAVFPQFENLRGSVGARQTGPRLKGAYYWSVDGKPVPGNKVQDAAKVIGVPRKVLVDALIKWNEERGIEFDFANPPERFSFEYVSGDPTDPDKQLHFPVSAQALSSDDDDEAEDEAVLEEVDEDDPFGDD